MRYALLILSILLFLAGSSAAQTALTTSLSGFHCDNIHGLIAPETFVRDRAGHLYFVYNNPFNPPQLDIAIARSTDNGKNWNLKWQAGFASNPSGDFGNYSPSLVVDGNGNLHCAWVHRPTSTSAMTVRYNRYASGSWGTEVTTAMTPGRYSNKVALAVDSLNFVYLMHPYGGSGQAALLRSNMAYASDLKFTQVSPAFAASGRVYETSMAVDAMDQVHVSYYCSSGLTVRHQVFDGKSWSQETVLGNTDLCADWPGRLCADLQGNVYAFYGVDSQAAWDKTNWDPRWELRKWDGTTRTWGTPILVYKTTRTQYRHQGQDSNNEWFISVVCEEISGEVYCVYRNFNSGEYLLARWHDGDPAPTVFARMMTTGSLVPNYPNRFYAPQMRGSLFPPFNRTSVGLDILYTVCDPLASPATFTLTYDSFPVGAMSSFGKPAIGTTYPLDLTAWNDGGMAYQVALTSSGTTPGLPVDRRFISLVPDSLFFITVANQVPVIFQDFSGTLKTTGTARAKVVIPTIPALVGLKIHGAFVTYPGGPAGVKTVSNPWGFTISK